MDDKRWIATVKSNQQTCKANAYETLATSTTPTNSAPVSGSLVLIATAGDDHFVSFNGDATETSALVPKGQSFLFEIDDIEDGTTISVRTASGTGYVTIYPQV